MQELQWQFIQQTQGNCGKCKKPIQNGGWIKFSKDGVSAILCDECKNITEEIEEVTQVKKSKLTVREVSSFFGIFGKHYEVLSSTNLIVEKIINPETLMKFLDSETVVTIKY